MFSGRHAWLAGVGAIVLVGCGGALQPGSTDPGTGGATGEGGTMGEGGTTGMGGATGMGGTGGVRTPIDVGPCVQPAADAALARFQSGVVGTWLGVATSQPGWTWESATVELTFYCDGHYQSTCLAARGIEPDNCVALYWGSDVNDAKKTYEIFDVRADGKASGEIILYFAESVTTTVDELRAIDLSAAGDQLAFDLIHLGQYGPVHYDLRRALVVP